MRAIDLVLAVLVGGCGDGSGDGAAQYAGDAPACDLPETVCADGTPIVTPQMQQEGKDTFRCIADDRSTSELWNFYSDGGPAAYVLAGKTSTTCWSADTTVARLQDYTGDGSITCWDRDGEPADCADVEAELFEITQ